MANISDRQRNHFMLRNKLAKRGYDWWWHSFTAEDAETGEEKPFFIEYFTCNPGLAEDKPVLGQHPDRKTDGKKPSYLMVKVGWWREDAGQLHRFFPWKEVQLPYDTNLSLTAGDCGCSETRMYGRVSISPKEAEEHPEYMCNSGEMSWDMRKFIARRSDEDIRELEKIIASVREAGRRQPRPDTGELAELACSFHCYVCAKSGNNVVPMIVNGFHDLNMALWTMWVKQVRGEEVAEMLEEFLYYIKVKDANSAVKLFRRSAVDFLALVE